MTQIVNLTKATATITLKDGTKKRFEVKTVRQMDEVIGWLESDVDIRKIFEGFANLAVDPLYSKKFNVYFPGKKEIVARNRRKQERELFYNSSEFKRLEKENEACVGAYIRSLKKS